MAFYVAGAEMIRPGVYHRYENAGGAIEAGARDGVCALLLRASWGPLNEVVTIESKSEIKAAFGPFEGESVAARALMGGCKKLLCVRVGNGGEKQSLTLTGDGGGVRLVAKHVGERALSVTVRDSLLDENAREALICDGESALICRVTIEKGGDEAQALAGALNALEISPVTAVYVSGGTLLPVLTARLTGGEDPAATAESYADAFELLAAERFTVLLIDTAEQAVQAQAVSFIERCVEMGLLAVTVLGGAGNYEANKARAAALDSKNVIYVVNGALDESGGTIDGAAIAAIIGGMVAAVPSNLSLTHRVVPGVAGLKNPLTNAQIESCLSVGALALTTSAGGSVWVESGVNTLKTLAANEDAGWKKIRRVKTRYELIGRIDESVAAVIGQVNNDANGRATVLMLMQGIINRMIAEGKLVSGAAAEDPDRPAMGDSAHFVLSIDDLDSAERVYLRYGFSFSAA